MGKPLKKPTETILSKTDPFLLKNYSDLVEYFPDAVFVVDEQGTYRFKKSPLARWLCDRINLNDGYVTGST